ncbi:UNVERIFIED_CONTAM: hypothetical protein HDU68_009828 [Siphonaria sp. JEL0065]|nr:hypothetical protein HDU68_009828 [Siphonaria sp. JEL0065]
MPPPTIQITHHPRKGRSVTASTDIRAGSIVHIAIPYAAVPDAEQYFTTCAHCVQVPKSSARLSVQCLGGCERTFYCNETCRKKDWRLHRLQCPAIREFLSLGGRNVTGLVEEYARLLIRVLATRFDEIEHENDDDILVRCNQANYVEDGTPIPYLSPEAQRFDSIWKLVTNADHYSLDRLKNEFLPVALVLTRMISVHLFPLLPHTSKYETPELLLPQCTDKILIDLAETAVLTQTTSISQNPLFTELYEPPLLAATTPLDKQQSPTSIASPTSVTNATRTSTSTISSTTSHHTKMSPQSTISLLASTLALICKEECNSFGHYSFSILGQQFQRQGYALGVHPSAVFFNHSCSPNVGHVPRPRVSGENGAGALEYPGMMVFFAIDDIRRGEELCLSYVGVQGLHDYKRVATTATSPLSVTTLGGGEMTALSPLSALPLRLSAKEKGNDSIDMISPNTRHSNVLQRRKKLKKVFTFDCDCTRCIVELNRYPEERKLANSLLEELRASGGAGVGAIVEVERLEVDVERRVGLYSCGLEGCKAFLVPTVLGVGNDSAGSSNISGDRDAGVDGGDSSVSWPSSPDKAKTLQVSLHLSTGFSGTEFQISHQGLFLWPSAKPLAQYLIDHPAIVKGKRVLELGAGVGLTTCVAAKLDPLVLVATDFDNDTLAQLAQNLENNKQKHTVTTKVSFLDWRQLIENVREFPGDVERRGRLLGDMIGVEDTFEVFLGSDLF